MDASESALGFDFGVMSLRYKSEGYQLPAGHSDPSGASVTDFRFSAFNDDRYLPKATGILQHVLQPLAVRFHIIIGCLIPIG
jgi:hypothetical protein